MLFNKKFMKTKKLSVQEILKLQIKINNDVIFKIAIVYYFEFYILKNFVTFLNPRYIVIKLGN